MDKASEYQERVIEMVEKIGNIISMMEKVCNELEEHIPVLTHENKEQIRSIFYPFIISHKKYTIKYNEMRTEMFRLLRDGWQITAFDDDSI
jgi:translation elongation factor EF-G